jgi:hypothetical protein
MGGGGVVMGGVNLNHSSYVQSLPQIPSQGNFLDPGGSKFCFPNKHRFSGSNLTGSGSLVEVAEDSLLIRWFLMSFQMVPGL